MNQIDQLLFDACHKGCISTMELLLGSNDYKTDIEVLDKYGSTLLSYASKHGYIKIVELLLQYGANVNAIGSGGMTPLMFACQGGFIDIVKTLLEQGSDINIKDCRGLTALQFAFTNEYTEIVELLEQYKSNIKYFYMKFTPGAEDALNAIMEKAKKCTKTEVIKDALKIYLWLLDEKEKGNAVGSWNEKTRDHKELVAL